MSSDSREKELKRFISSIGLKTIDFNLLDEALTHPSYAYEHQTSDFKHYERLEFLGDSYLKNITAEFLFDRFPSYPEGKLTKLLTFMVSDYFLSHLADEIDLPSYIKVGQSEIRSDGVHKESIRACAFEAILAAMAKSGELEFLKNFLAELYIKNSDYIKESLMTYNSKAILQEYTQGIDNTLPEYRVISQEGKPHNLTFEVGVFYNGEEIGRGSANSKKEAEKSAANDAIKRLNIKADLYE